MQYLPLNTDMAKVNNVRDFFVDFVKAIRAKIKDIGTIIPTNIPSIIESADPTNFGRFSNAVIVSLSEGITGIKTVSFHPSVKTIKAGAYKNLSSIDTLVLPDNLETIEDNAFQGCSSLTEINIPNSVTAIGSRAFSGCRQVEILNVPDTTRISVIAGFEDMIWYTNQEDGVVYIGSNAYRYKGTISEDTSIEIKEGTRIITQSAFKEQSNLEQIKFPATTYFFGTDSFGACTELKKIEILGSNVTIGFAAFGGCTSLEEVYINDVSYFDVGSFSNCTNLAELTIMNLETLPAIGTNAFQGIDKNNFTVYVANSEMQEKFKASNQWGSYNIQIAEQIN